MVARHDSVLPDWAVERGRALNLVTAIDPARAALVVIDMQTAFMAEGAVFGNPYAMGIIDPVNDLARAARSAGLLVVWTRQTVSDDPAKAPADWHYDRSHAMVARALASLSPGHPDHDLHPAMILGEGDHVIDKYRYSAFIQGASTLESLLRARGVELVIIAGTLTNVCCETTARDGYMLGFRMLMCHDAMAAVTDAEHNASLMNLRLNFADVRSSGEIRALLAPG